MKYEVCESYNFKYLGQEVNYLMDKGYRPHGPPIATFNLDDQKWHYAQAMLLDENVNALSETMAKLQAMMKELADDAKPALKAAV